MRSIVEEDITKELDNIYGIEEDKWEILNYVKYLEISKKNPFANYNVIIHNRSSYPAETKIKLIEFLYKMLKKNNIIASNYEFLSSSQLRKYNKNDEDDDDDENNRRNKRSKKNNKEEEKINSDLIIIDSEKISRNLDCYRDEIINFMESHKEKIFIIIDKSFCVGEVNATFNQYFDWFFMIGKISEKNKKNYVINVLNENNISVKEDCKYIDNFTQDQFFIVKSNVNHVILQCKINKINEINDEIARKYLNTKNILNNECENERIERKNKENLNINSLVGINDIKDEINKIVNYVKICKQRKENMPMLHMCFTGNPGTGKTTVARIIGQIFKKEKILSSGEFVEIHGRDLVGRYVGWTAQEVKKCVWKARGGVLFIDEAYSLNTDRRGSFEDEAIATLIKEMEDNRDDICIILAGYQEEMKELIKRNPGFESRIQFYIDFQNYDEEELYEIFKNLAKKEKYKISRNVKEVLQENFKVNRSSKNFSNGRYIRNLYEKVKMEQANRVSLNEDDDINLIKKCDVENVLEKIKPTETPKFKIGFVS